MISQRRLLSYLFVMLAAVLLAGCKTPKLKDAVAKQELGEYYTAADMYRRIYTKSKPDQKELRAFIAYRMGDCNRLIGNTARAISAYRNAERYEYPDSTVALWLAQMLHRSGNYAEAIKQYRQYLDSDTLPHSDNRRLALSGIAGCEAANLRNSQPTLYTVSRMEPFNSRRSECCPMLYGDTYDRLYFNSTRGPVAKDSVSGITGMKNNALFVVAKDEHGAWQKPEEVKDPVATVFDIGTPSFTRDGQTMFYTYCSYDGIEPRTAEIYVSSRSGAAWNKGSRAPIVKDSVTLLAHPAVSPSADYLYFVSDAVGGYGGKDLFRARFIGMNDFGPLENLGPAINTPGNELFPYMRDSATLYFASDGHPGMGGLDLYKATLDSTGQWHVTHMGVPLNSPGDDFGITFEGTNERGYFSSNRNEPRGWDHIYSFSYPTFTVAVEGFVSDVEEYVVEGATIHIVGKDGLNLKVPAKPDGSYRVELERGVSYVMMASAPGYLNQYVELQTEPDEKNETYYADFFLASAEKPVVVENIFYDFDRAELRPESKEALDKLIKILNENPAVAIELGAHTDRHGPDRYNEGLAQRRAQSVVDYLIAAGIDSVRLTAKGYGETVPKTIHPKLAEKYPFLPVDTVLTEAFVRTLTPDEQEIADQLNRRTEFQVVEVERLDTQEAENPDAQEVENPDAQEVENPDAP